MKIDNDPIYPNSMTWEYRKNKFRHFEGHALGEHGQESHPQKEALIRELEHTYCAGAWLSTILLAFTIIDIQLTYFGYPNKKGERGNNLTAYLNMEEIERLRVFRNEVFHRAPDQLPAITSLELVFEREALRRKATLAVSLSLRTAFLCTKHPELNRNNNALTA